MRNNARQLVTFSSSATSRDSVLLDDDTNADIDDVFTGDESDAYASGFWQQYSAVRRQRWRSRMLWAGGVCAVVLVLVLSVVIGALVYELNVAQQSSNDNHHDNKPSGDDAVNEFKRTLPIYARDVLATMDRTADPCDDFYTYACGGWMKNTVLPADKSSMTRSFTKISDENIELLRELVEDQWPLVSPFYESCMDNDTRRALGMKPIQDVLSSISQITNKESLVAALASLHMYQVNVFFSFEVMPDLRDPLVTIAALDQGGIGLPSRDYYFKNDTNTINIRAAYKTYIATGFSLLGVSDPERAAQRVFDIEMRLANASLTPEERRDPYELFHEKTASELSVTSPNIDWTRYFEKISISLKSTEKINVATPEFINEVNSILGDLEWQLDAIKDYMAWQLLRSSASLLTPEFEDQRFAFNKVLYGSSKPPPLWRQCVSATSDYLGFVLGHLYTMQRFPKDSKTQAQTLIDNIEAEFAQIIGNLTWMDQSTKQKSLTKLEKISNKIGYPDVWPTYDVIVEKGKYWTSAMSLRLLEFKRHMQRLHSPTDRNEWEMFPHTVNAYYRPDLNEIVFPAGIMQPPFFKLDYLNSMNYGGIGVVIGHEITHGFDDEGRNFDGDGKLVNWWSTNTANQFKAKAKCVSGQYSQFTVNDGAQHVNGDLTLGENIADNGGVKQAFGAYKKSKELVDDDFITKTFEGLTNDQLFFVSFGQVWCSKYTPQALAWLVTTNPHSPGHYRVMGPMQNSKYFADVFQCSADAKMNPKEKCVVW